MLRGARSTFISGYRCPVRRKGAWTTMWPTQGQFGDPEYRAGKFCILVFAVTCNPERSMTAIETGQILSYSNRPSPMRPYGLGKTAVGHSNMHHGASLPQDGGKGWLARIALKDHDVCRTRGRLASCEPRSDATRGPEATCGLTSPLTGQRSFLPIEAVKLHLIGVRASHHASCRILLSARVVRAD